METSFHTIVDGPLDYRPSWESAARDTWIRSPQQIEIRIGRGSRELLGLEQHWQTLAGNTGQTCFIHTFAWQMACLKHLAADPEAIYYLSCFASGHAIAIFPLRHVCRSVGRLKLWLWEMPTSPHIVLSEPLLAPEWASGKLLRQVLRALDRKLNLPWDALHLPNLPENSVALRHLMAVPLPRTHIETTGQSMFFHCIDKTSALANCSGQFKRNLRRQSKKLSQRGFVSFSMARRGPELDAAFREFLRLEASGWKGVNGRGSAILLHPNLVDFYTELKDRFAESNQCLITLLELDGIAIAAQFCLQAGDTLYIQKIAYDEAWHAEAPGNQLLYKTLEHCCADPAIEKMSLVTGPEWAVGRWNPEQHEVREAYLFRNSPRGLTALGMRRFRTRLWEPAQALWRRLRDGWRTPTDNPDGK